LTNELLQESYLARNVSHLSGIIAPGSLKLNTDWHSGIILGEVYSMIKTMTPDPGKYDPGKLNDDTDSMTTLSYDVPSLDLAK